MDGEEIETFCRIRGKEYATVQMQMGPWVHLWASGVLIKAKQKKRYLGGEVAASASFRGTPRATVGTC